MSDISELYKTRPERAFSPREEIKQISDAERAALLQKNEEIFQLKLVPSTENKDHDGYSNEEVLGEYAALEAKLNSYEDVMNFGDSLKKWALIMNVVILPLIIGVMISLFISTSKNSVLLSDIAANMTAENK